MMRCIVVDDEKIILDELCGMIAQTETEIQGAFQDPFEAFQKIKNVEPDAVFLDIEMPGLNGIELAREIAKFKSEIQIVFVTAYEQYALKAFEVSAVHYLLKPLTQEKINEAVKRIKRVKAMNKNNGNIEKPEVVMDKMGTAGRISIKDRDTIIIIKIHDIIYLKSEGGKIVIVTKKGSYRARTGLQFWENKLEGLGFIRCHRSFIVNTAYITKMIHILGEHKELVLDYCDVNIPISRNKVAAIQDWLGIL